MTVARRLLLVSGPGTFSPIPTWPPFDASWTRSPSNPIITPTEAWETTAVSEPVVRWDGSQFRIWYSGGWDDPGMGYATYDGTTVTKYSGNPVLGQGGSGLAGNVASPWVHTEGSTLHCYYSGGSPLRSTMGHYTSTDGLAWTSASLSITLPSGTSLWGNRTIWKDGTTYFMLQEALATIWRIYLYTSSDLVTWTIQNGGAAYGSLSQDGSALGAWGGPRLAEVNGTLRPTFGGILHIWYHASNTTGNLPTDIYHASNVNWFNDSWQTNGPVLTHLGSSFEVDQVAGGSVLVVNGTAYLFYDGDDNTGSGAASIGVATAPARFPS